MGATNVCEFLLWDMLARLVVGSFCALFLLCLGNTLAACVCIFVCDCNIFMYRQCLGVSAAHPSVYFGLCGDGMIKLCFGIYAFVEFSSKLKLWWEAHITTHITILLTSCAQHDFWLLEWSGFFPKRGRFPGEACYFDYSWGEGNEQPLGYSGTVKNINALSPILLPFWCWEINCLCSQALSTSARHSS